MEKNKKIIIGIVIAIVAVVGVVVVVSVVTSPFYGLDERVQTNFEKYDLNQNMYLELDEITAQHMGSITPTITDMENKFENNNTYFENKAKKVIKKYDLDGDGKLNPIETHNWMIGNS